MRKRSNRLLPPTLALSLTTLRLITGWSQAALAKASGTVTSQLSQYEGGTTRLTYERFAVLAKVMDPDGGVGEFVMSMVALLRSMVGGDVEAPPDDLTPKERRAVSNSVLRMLRAEGEVLYQHAVEQVQIHRVEAARQDAADLWRVLAEHNAVERRVLLDNGLAFQTWAMCMQLCDESIVAASRSGSEALQLAELAMRAAQLAKGDSGVLRRLQGYALAFVANAHRLRGNLPAADTGFAEAIRLWEAGRPGEFSLGRWRLIDLEASLRWAQQDWLAAAALSDRALQGAPPEECCRLLIKGASALRAADQLEASLAALDAAAPRAASHPEAQWLVHYNEVVCLCRLGRYDEAGLRLDGAVAASVSDTLSLVRRLWLKAHVAAAQGKPQQGICELERIRNEVLLSCNGHEATLVFLDLAILYLKNGMTGELRELARSLFEAFQMQSLPRETWSVIVTLRSMAETNAASVPHLCRIYRELEYSRIPLEPGLGARPAAVGDHYAVSGVVELGTPEGGRVAHASA